MTQINRKNRDRRGGHLSDGFFDDEGCWMTTPTQRKFSKVIKSRANRQSVKNAVRNAIAEMIEDQEIDYREQVEMEIEEDNFYAHMQDYDVPEIDDFFEDYDMSNDYDNYSYDCYDDYYDDSYYDRLNSYTPPVQESKPVFFEENVKTLGDILAEAIILKKNM